MNTEDDPLLARVAASPARRAPAVVRGLRRFELIRRLGAGAFGEVYEARDRESGGTLAVKILRVASADRLFRFKREFRAVADLVHPNLVRLFELVEEDDCWYLTMEYIDGLAFDEHVQRVPEQARGCFGQLGRAIDALHRAGHIHRDVKPSNILVERTGRVVLLDFGLIRAVDGDGNTSIAGTPAYMAPEQLRGEELTEAADWYAFGVMIYQALTGELPFTTGAEQRGGAPPRAPSTVRPGVDPELERLCMRLLSPLADARPTAREILEILEASERADTADTRDPEPFAGRARELGQLRSALARVHDSAVLVLLEGAAGMGKSALLEEFTREVDAERGLVFSGRCHEAESVPFKGVDAVVDAISEYLRRQSSVDAAAVLPREALALATMFPVLKRVEAFAHRRAPRLRANRGPIELRRVAIAALRELVARLSDNARVVVVIDDLHWATEDGAQLLLELLAPPAPPVLFVASYRHEAVGRTPPLDRFIAQVAHTVEPAPHRIELGPLTRPEVAALLTSNDAPPLEGVDAWEETGGHPFLLTRLLRARGATSTSAGLTGVLDEQLARLSSAARRVLEVVCLSAAPLTQGAACEAAGLTSWSPGVLDELRSPGLVRSLGRGVHAHVEPYHDRVREKVLSTLAEGPRRASNLALARFLETHRRADAEAIAQHYAAGGEPPLATLWLRRAAVAAEGTLAFARAAELYGRAAELSPRSERSALLRARGDALVNAGFGQDAARAYEAALVGPWPERERLELRRRAAEQRLKAGFLAEGLAHLEPVLAAIGESVPATPGRALATLVLRRAQLALSGLRFQERPESQIDPALLSRIDACWAAGLGLANIETVRGMALLTRHLLLSLTAGHPGRLARGLAIEAMFSGAAGGAASTRAEALVHTAAALAAKIDEPHAHLWVHIGRGMVSFSRSSWTHAYHQLTAAIPLAREQPGTAWELGTAQFFTGLVCQYLGRFAELRQEVPRWADEATARGDRYTETIIRAATEPWLHLLQDHPAVAHDAVRRARDGWPTDPTSFPHLIGWLSSCATLLYEDRASEAWQLVSLEWPALVQSRMMDRIIAIAIRGLEMRVGAALALARARGGDHALQAHALADARRLRRKAIPWAVALAAQSEAAVALLERDPRRASLRLAEAEATFGSVSMEGHRQAVRYRRGQLEAQPALIERARAWMTANGVAQPARWVRQVTPGFPS